MKFETGKKYTDGKNILEVERALFDGLIVDGSLNDIKMTTNAVNLKNFTLIEKRFTHKFIVEVSVSNPNEDDVMSFVREVLKNALTVRSQFTGKTETLVKVEMYKAPMFRPMGRSYSHDNNKESW